MKQSKLIGAYNIIKSLNSTGMKGISLATQLKLYNLQKQLVPAYEFHVEKEKEIFTDYPPTEVENGNITYKKEDGSIDMETLQACQKRLDELANLENDSIKIEPIHLSMKEAEALKPEQNSNIIEALDEILVIDMDETPQITFMPLDASES